MDDVAWPGPTVLVKERVEEAIRYLKQVRENDPVRNCCSKIGELSNSHIKLIPSGV